MQDVCIYCDICYAGAVLGTSKNICLDCLERIVDKSMYKDINPSKDYEIKYDKNKIICETCNQSHSLFITSHLCSNHKKQFQHLYEYGYDDSCYDSREDYYDYKEHESFFMEIKNEIIEILKVSKLTYKIFKSKTDDCNFEHCHYIFIYRENVIVCKFIYLYHRLALIFNDKIYATSTFSAKFREMYFHKLNYKLLEINEILEVFKNHFKIKYNLMKNFDIYIKPEDLVFDLINRFEILNDPLISIQSDWCKCNDCEYNDRESYNQVITFIYDSVEILRVVYSDTKLSVWIQNKIYTNEKDQCLHFNSHFKDKSGYLNFREDNNDKSKFKYLNFSIEYNIEYKSLLEIYKLVVNFPSRFKEKRTWSDITKCNK